MKTKIMKTTLVFLTALMLTTALVACGGGGGDGSNTPAGDRTTLSGTAQ